MDDLVTFLRARLDEDERAALEIDKKLRAWQATGGYPECYPMEVRTVDGVLILEESPDLVTHIARHDPARVLRDVTAKRQLLDWLDRFDQYAINSCLLHEPDTDDVRKALASRYDDHPDYRPEWKPDA